LFHISYGVEKGKVIPVLFYTEHHAMKAYWGSGRIAPLILYLSTRWRRVVSFTAWPLYTQGKSLWYPLDKRLDGPQSRSGSGGEERIYEGVSKSFRTESITKYTLTTINTR
jgi:hypothetical protein